MTLSLLWLPNCLPSQVCQGAQQLKSSNGRPFSSLQDDYINGYIHVFVGTLAKLWKEAISFVMSVRPSVRMDSASTGRIFMKLEFEEFSKICPENSRVIKIGQKWRAIYMKNVHFWSHLAHFFLEWEMFQTKVVEKIKTHILCAVTFVFYIVPFVR